MKNFVVVYDLEAGRLREFLTFSPEEEDEARRQRFARELSAMQEGKHFEIVLLQAEDEEALRHTHARYFDSIDHFIDEFKRRLAS